MREDPRDLHFARDADGREVFTAPYGRSYVVPDVETGAVLRRIVRRSPWLLAIAIGAIATPLAMERRPWYWIFLAAPLFAALDVIPIYRATRGLEAVRAARSAAALRQDLARSRSTGRLWAFEVLMLVAVFVATPSLAQHGQTSLAWGMGAASAAGAIAFAWLLWLRTR